MPHSFSFKVMDPNTGVVVEKAYPIHRVESIALQKIAENNFLNSKYYSEKAEILVKY
jgi:hypothetical protein